MKCKIITTITLTVFSVLFTITNAQSIYVNSIDYKQTITMMGGDMERSGANLQSASNKEQIIDWFIKDIPFNTWRVKYDKIQEMNEGRKTWNVYDDDILTMKMIKAVNPNIKFFATLKSDYGGYSEGNHNNWPTFIYDYAVTDGVESGSKSFNTAKYGVFLADYVEYMSNQGVPITYLSTSKECYWIVSAQRAKEIIISLRSELASRGVAMPLIVDAGSWSITEGIKNVNEYNAAGTTDLVSGFCSHNLWSGENKSWDEFIGPANAAGKPAFADESSSGGSSYLIPAGSEVPIVNTINTYAEKCEMYSAGLAGELMFEVWPRGYGEVQSDGSFWAKPVFFHSPAGITSGQRMRSYYIMKQFGSNILDHKFVTSNISSMPNVTTMAFRKDNKVALWVINSGGTRYDSFPIIINDSQISGSVSSTYWTDSTAITGATSTYSSSGDRVTPTVEGYSINCYIINLSGEDSDSCSSYISKVSPPPNLEEGIEYNYYEGVWNTLPNFNSLTPVSSGVSSEISLKSTTTSADNFGYTFEGYLNLPQDGSYTFYTTSDDGSALWIDGIKVVDNDGIHGVIERSGNICLEAGYHKISVAYFERTGGDILSVDYQLPGGSKTALSSFYVEAESISLTDFVPDPNKKYYVDVPALDLRLAATGFSEDAYSTSTSTIGANVEWKFVDKGNGSWHLQLAAGGSKSRLRSDVTEDADMQSVSSNGSKTYFDISPGALPGTYHLNLPDGPFDFSQLQINRSGLVRFVEATRNGTWESFRFTEAGMVDGAVASIKIEAEDYDGMEEIQTEATTDINGGENVGWINDGDWLRFDNVNLSGLSNMDARIACNFTGGTIEVHTGSISGPIVGSISITSTGGNQSWVTKNTSISNASGIQDVYLVFTGGSGYLFNVNWIEFNNSSTANKDIIASAEGTQVSIYPNPVSSTATIANAANSTININDINGRLLLSQSVLSKSQTLDLSLLSTGIYYLEVIGGTTKSVKKIIKK